jgi:hypothetical protein
MIQALFLRSRQHGAGIDHLLYGFVVPILWPYFLMNFMPVYFVCSVFVWSGVIIRGFVKPAARQPAADFMSAGESDFVRSCSTGDLDRSSGRAEPI